MNRLTSLTLALVALLLALPAGASATTIQATTLNDDYMNGVTCSLRQALEAANTNTAFGACPAGSASDVISLRPGVHRLIRNGVDDTNVNGDLDISAGSVRIESATRAPTVIDGGGAGDRVFHVFGGISGVEVRGVEIRNGGAGLGGGIENNGGLLLRDVTLTHNTAGNGGGLANLGNGNAQLRNVTLSHNTAEASGGGLFSDSGAGSVDLRNVTITGNRADGSFSSGGGGIARATGAVTIANTILAGNIDYVTGEDDDCSGTVLTNGHNLLGTATGCSILPAATDQVGQPAGLGALTENSGPTRTHLPLASSAAVNQGSPLPTESDPAACLAADQRGVGRPRESACDIGAVERVPENVLAIDTSMDQLQGGTPGSCSLREAVQAANTNTSVDNCGTGSATAIDVIALGNVSPQMTRVGGNEDANSTGDIDILSGNIAIRGNPTSFLNQINAGGTGFASDRVIQVGGGLVGVEIRDVDISGGSTEALEGRPGAGVENNGELLMRDVTLEFNSSGEAGGGLANLNGGIAVLRNVTINQNSAASAGGGISTSPASFTSLNNVTVSDNEAGLFGGGVYIDAPTATGGTSTANSVFTENSPNDCQGSLSSEGYNLISGVPGCSFAPLAGDETGVDALLGPIELAGARVRLPDSGSPAIGSGYPGTGLGSACVEADQRGIARPLGEPCDKGAAELGLRTITVSIDPTGTGDGTVTAQGISCPGDCTAEYYEGSTLELQAQPDSNSTFAGWGGACSGAGTCTVTLDTDKAVSARFDAIPRTLTVSTSGTGAGTVSGPGITCPGDCSETYASGTAVTLTATPSGTATFTGWGGDCAGTGQCTLSVTSDRSASATFTAGQVTPPPPPDTTAPETTITGGPPKRTRSRSATIRFGANEGDVRFECSLDGKAFASCASPRKLRNLARRAHSFRVRAIDAAGNVDATPAKRTWKVTKRKARK